MAENDKARHLAELQRQLAWEEQLQKKPWAFKGSQDAAQDNKDRIANLKAEISRLGG